MVLCSRFGFSKPPSDRSKVWSGAVGYGVCVDVLWSLVVRSGARFILDYRRAVAERQGLRGITKKPLGVRVELRLHHDGAGCGKAAGTVALLMQLRFPRQNVEKVCAAFKTLKCTAMCWNACTAVPRPTMHPSQLEEDVRHEANSFFSHTLHWTQRWNVRGGCRTDHLRSRRHPGTSRHQSRLCPHVHISCPGMFVGHCRQRRKQLPRFTSQKRKWVAMMILQST